MSESERVDRGLTLFASLNDRARARLAVAGPPLVSLVLGALVHARVSMALPVADAYVYNIAGAGLVGQNAESFYGPHWALGVVG